MSISPVIMYAWQHQVLVSLLTVLLSVGTVAQSGKWNEFGHNISSVINRRVLGENYVKEFADGSDEVVVIKDDCPTWMYHGSNISGRCICGDDHHHAIKCEREINQVYILDCYMMTYDEEKGEEVLGSSVYGYYGMTYKIYHPLPRNKTLLNEAMCGPYNRKGRLCGECKDGYSPLVYSYNINCSKCSEDDSRKNIIKFVAVALIPLTVFYLIVVIFNFNANSPKMQGFILYAQSISTPSSMRELLNISHELTLGVKVIINVFATLYGVSNLDFFRTIYPDICLNVTTLQMLALDYVTAFYPLFLILVTTILVKLHSRGCKAMLLICYPLEKCLSRLTEIKKVSMINVFATFLLLSYGRIMSVSFNLLIYTQIVNSRGELVGRYLYYDTSYEFLGKEHLPYGAIALFVFITFNVLPLALLFLYPMRCFQKCLNHFKLSFIALHTFVDSFAGCYKDGTEPGVPDCRYFAGLFLLIRLLFYIVYDATKTDYFFGISGIIALILLLLYATIQPYKAQYSVYNKVTVAMLGALILVLTSAENIVIAQIKMYQANTLSIITFGVITILPSLYIGAIILKFLLSKIKISVRKRYGRRPSEESLLNIGSRNIYT